MLLASLRVVFNFLKENWKAVLAIVYAIAVPLYFYSSTLKLQQALDSSRESSKKEIKVLEDTIQKQSSYYDGLFKQYQIAIEQEQVRHEEEIRKIREVQAYQQSLLAQRLKDPTQMAKELKERYNLNGN